MSLAGQSSLVGSLLVLTRKTRARAAKAVQVWSLALKGAGKGSAEGLW